jgi:hypothetical protein
MPAQQTPPGGTYQNGKPCAPPSRLDAAGQALVLQWLWLPAKVVRLLGTPERLRKDALAEARWALCRAALRWDPLRA